jgi:hypothetical protein
MRALNERERVACVYECQQSDMQKQMLDAINKRLVAKQTTTTTSFSIAIDATKVPQLLDISTTFKAIMGGAHPHHMISTIDLDSSTIKNILDRGEMAIDKASEVKVAFMVFQKPPPGVSPIAIVNISAQPQSNKMFKLHCRHHECCRFCDQAGSINIFCQLCSGWGELGGKGCNEKYATFSVDSTTSLMLWTTSITLRMTNTNS